MVDYRWRAAKTIDLTQKLNIYLAEGLGILLTYHLSICFARSFVLKRFCTPNWVTKFLMGAISNVHAGRTSVLS